jgi:hypothetical protein
VVVMMQQLAAGHLSWPELREWFENASRTTP